MQPIFDSLTPPGMNLSFAKLQFGDAPIRVEAVRMDRERTDGVYLEFDVRWAGEPEVKLKAGVPGCASCSPSLLLACAWSKALRRLCKYSRVVTLGSTG